MKKNIILLCSVILAAIISLLGFRLIFPDISPVSVDINLSGGGGVGGGKIDAMLTRDIFEKINQLLYKLLLGELEDMKPQAREELLQSMMENVSDMGAMEELLEKTPEIDQETADQLIEAMKDTDPEDLAEFLETLAEMDTEELDLLIENTIAGEMSISPSPTSGDSVASECDMLPDIPVFTVTGAKNTPYLRTSAMAAYRDGSWYIEDNVRISDYSGNEIPVPDINLPMYPADTVTIKPIVTFAEGFIPVALYTIDVTGDAELSYYPETFSFRSEDSFSSSYTFNTVRFDERQVPASAKTDNLELYFQIPDTITERTRELAEEIVTGLTSPYAKAKVIEDYLRTNYTYDREYQHAPEGQEPIEWFLFTEKRGICGNFNSAFVMLCRCAGIPARLVTGYSVPLREEEQEVRSKQAHAWAEVPFIDYGWITFDAVPSDCRCAGGSGDEVRENGTPTVTEITGVSTPREEGAQKGHAFTVTGQVLTETTGLAAQGIAVEIYVDTVKGKGGKLIGTGEVPSGSADGEFNIECSIDNEVHVGSYQLIAHAIGDSNYAESWSDPELKILSNTVVSLNLLEEVNVDERITLEGVLTEELGDPVPFMVLEVTVSDGSEGQMVRSGIDGTFSLPHIFSEPGEYTVTVMFEDTGYHFGSVDQQAIRVMMPTVLKLDVPDEAFPHDPVTIIGTLTANDGTPLPGEDIGLFIDGVAVPGQSTDANGRFSYPHSFTESGPHTIEARFLRHDFLLESTDSVMVMIIEVVIDVSTPDMFVRGDDAVISGKVLTKNGPITGEPLQILFDDRILTESATDSDGEFSYTYHVDEELDLGAHAVTYVLEGYERTRIQEIQVKSRTFLSVTVPDEIKAGETVTAVVVLTDDHGDPLAGMNIVTGDLVIHGPTDENGELPVIKEIAEDTVDASLLLSFEFQEDDLYLGSAADAEIRIVRKQTIPLWLLILIPGIFVLGVAGYFCYRYIRKARGNRKMAPVHFITAKRETETQERDLRQTGITIGFPQIDEPFPDVWGVGDILHIIMTLRDGQDAPLPGRNINVAVSGEQDIKAETGETGDVSIERTFPKKGEYTVKAGFAGDGEYLASQAVRQIRIVDYREEIVRLYAELMEWVITHNVRLPVDVTPRILEMILVRSLAGIDERSLDTFLWHFEEADYSTHEVGRAQYEKAYLALNQVRDSYGGDDEQSS